MNNTHNLEIFRSVIAKEDTVTRLHEYRNTMRAPGHVPYVVDNLWEWKRPNEYPSRRFSVFASPQKEIAREAGKSGGTVYRVNFNGKYKLCQLKGYKDSKYHPDCSNLKKLLLRMLGRDWTDDNQANREWPPGNLLIPKETVGRLRIPCLTKNEMDKLFGEIKILQNIHKEIYNAITYWDNTVLIQQGEPIPDPAGELFFEAEAGYYLRNIEDKTG